MKNNFILTLIVFISLIGLVSAYDFHKQNTDFDLVINSNNATACNASYLQSPNGSVTVYNLPLTKNGQTFYNTLTSGNFTSFGVTCIGVTCTDGTNIAVGSVCVDTSSSSGNVIIVFGIIFVILIFFLIWELIMSVGHFMNLDFDIADLSKAWSTYFALLALYWLETLYLGNSGMEVWLLLFIKIGGFTHILVPLVAFIISITVGSLKKKKFDVGMKHFKRTNLEAGGNNGKI